MVGGPVDDLSSDLESNIGILGDPGFVVGDRHDRRTVFGDQGQHPLQAILLARD